jgi:hypothetical protein
MTRVFLLLAIVIYVITGIALLAVPVQFIGVFGLSLGPPATVMARLLASAELFMGLTLVLMLGDTVSGAARAVFAGQTLYNIAAAIVLILAIMAGRLDPIGGVLVFIHAILAAGFAWSWIDGGR